MEDMHSLIIIDDAVSRLKRLADPLSNLLLTHRHLKTSVHILAQDVMQVPLSIRANLTGGFFFKQSNYKRIQLLREEYLSFLSPEEYKKFECYIWKKKGDCLYVQNLHSHCPSDRRVHPLGSTGSVGRAAQSRFTYVPFELSSSI